MAIHHMAFATRDADATHRFYTELMGFHLAKVVTGPTPQGGWARHLFYATGGRADEGMIAFWELHVPAIGDVRTAISRDLGLPDWVNHLAFTARTRDDLDAARRRWTDGGFEVLEIDHGFCVSIYVNDPNGILVEWCHDTRPLDETDAHEAAERRVGPPTDMDSPVDATVHPPTNSAPISG